MTVFPPFQLHSASSEVHTSFWGVSKRAARPRVPQAAAQPARPTTLSEVQDWAREQFAQEIRDSPADALNLGKTCLLIALEDEAAAASSNRSWSIEWQRTSTGLFQTLLRPDLEAPSSRWHGDASTWNLSRLDALAAEARDVFRDTFDPAALEASSPAAQPTSSPPHPAQPSPPASTTSADALTEPRASAPESLPLTGSDADAATQPERSSPQSRPHAEPARDAESDLHSTSSGSSSSEASEPSGRSTDASAGSMPVSDAGATAQPDSSGLYSRPQAEPPSSAESPGPSSSTQDTSGGPSESGAETGGDPQPAWHGFSALSEQQQRSFMRRFPLHTMSSVNAVLFDRHGYMRMREHGDPRQALLNHVLEEGTGCPAALAILYTEICARMGLPLHIHSLDQGTYFVVWPQGSLRPCLDGQAVLFDPYSAGCPFLAREVSELFELDPQAELLPSGPAEILSGLLRELCRLHWCRAVRCDPRPSMMTDLSIETANSGKVSFTVVEEMGRAIAAAERQALLDPEDGEVHMRLVLLLYFASRYEEALAMLRLHEPAILGVHGFSTPFFDFRDRLQLIWDQQCLAARGDRLADIV